MKKLTIGIPTYNRKDELFNLVSGLTQNIQKQNLENAVELLVFDNCSTTHNVFSLLSDQLKNYSFLKILRNPANIGAGANFLRVLESASGQYVWLLGDDEILAFDKLGQLLSGLEKADLYLLPQNELYHLKQVESCVYENLLELYNRFFNLASFFVLSIYIFKRSKACTFLKTAYENIIFQHPYSSIAIKMLSGQANAVYLPISILRYNPDQYINPRFDMQTACVDILEMNKNLCDKYQFKSYLKNDFYTARLGNIFSLNLGITKKLSISQTLSNYRRIIRLMPILSKGSLLSRLWLIFTYVRRFNSLVSFLLYTLSKVKKNKFSSMSYKQIYIYIHGNLLSNQEIRH